MPKKTGVYSIASNGYLADCPSKLKSQPSTFKLTFDLADCNKDVYLSIPAPARGGELGFVDVSIDKKKIFVFKVE